MNLSTHSPTEVDTLRADWEALHREAAGRRHVFSSFDWIRHWMQFWGGDDHQLAILRDGDEPIAGLAFRQDGSRAACLEDHTYWSGLLAVDDDAAVAFCHALFNRAGLSVMEHEALGEDLAPDEDGLVTTAKHPAPFHAIEVPDSLDAYLEGRKSKVRRELKRKRRRLDRERSGVALATSIGAIDAHTRETVQAIERESWKEEAGTSITATDREAAFYDTLLQTEGALFTPRVDVLTSHEGPLAYVLGVVFEGVYYALKTSYPASLRKLSPGVTLFLELFEHLAESDAPCARVELLGRDSRFKRELATDSRTAFVHEIAPATLARRAQRLVHDRVRPRILALAEEHREVAQLLSTVRHVETHLSETVARVTTKLSS